MTTLPQRLAPAAVVTLPPLRRLLTATWLLPLLALGLTAIVFSGVGQCRFVRWDDDIHVYENPWLHPVTAVHVWHFWRTPYQGLYVPLSYTIYALLSLLARAPASGTLDPHVFHLANLALHLTNVALVFVILRRLGRAAWAAAAGALLFGVHPMQVETVAWVSELRGLVSALFSLLALWQYLKYVQASEAGRQPDWIRYALGTCAFTLALLAKPSAVAVPLLAVILDVGCIGRPWRRSLGPLGAWAAIALAWVCLSRAAQPVPPSLLIPAWQRFFVAGDALAFYLAHLVWPVRLCMDYGRSPATVLSHPWGFVAWLVPAAVSLVLWLHRRQAPWLLASALVFAAALLPVLGFVPFAFQRTSTVADRYIYLGMLGPALAVAWLLPRIPRPTIPVAAGLGVGALFLFCLQSSLQVLYWQNDVALFSRALSVNPHSWIADTDLGGALFDQGQTQQAIAKFQDGLRWNPDQPKTWNNLGAALNAAGRRPEALIALQNSLTLAPGFASAHNNLGLVLAEQGQARAGEGEFRAAIRSDPEFAEAQNNLGVVLERQGKRAAAVGQYRRALAINPDYRSARQNLARLSARAGH